ncbi:MAG: hypothetical protein SGPRY_013827 [Prymnesium sp.]
MAFHAGPADVGVMTSLRAMQRDGLIEHSGPLQSVHRLDRVTSGLLMVAKSPAAASEVSRLLRERRIHKYYIGLSSRPPSKKQGTVQGDMARSRRSQWMLLRSSERPAITRFISSPLATDPSRRSTKLRAFLLKPVTGRTHQLRVAMKALGAPVLGDELYAAAKAARLEDRTYLHASALRLPGKTFPMVSWGDHKHASFALAFGYQSTTYTHCTGSVTISGGEDPIEVICPPSDGVEFLTREFRDLWDSWFMPDCLSKPSDVWFAHTAVQSSSPKSWHSDRSAISSTD